MTQKNTITNKEYLVRLFDSSNNYIDFYEFNLNERNLENFITNKLMFQLDSKEIKSLTPDDIQKAKVFGKTIMILFEGKNINQDHSPLLEQFVEHKRIPVYRSGFQSPFQISIANDFDIKRTASQQLWILDYREGGSNPRRLKYASMKYTFAKI